MIMLYKYNSPPPIVNYVTIQCLCKEVICKWVLFMDHLFLSEAHSKSVTCHLCWVILEPVLMNLKLDK